MAIGSGIAAQLVYADEQANSGSFGVAQTLSSTYARPLEIKSETLQLNKTTVQGQGLHAGGLYDRTARRVLTNYAVSGGVVMDLPTRFIGLLLEHMTGGFGYTKLGPTEMSTTAVYQSVYWPTAAGLGGHSLTIQKGVPTTDGTVEPFTYVGCKISDWEIQVQTGALAQLTLTIDGRNELAGAYPNGGAAASGDPLNSATPSLATFDSIPASGLDLSSFHFREATLHTGGTPTVTSNVVALASDSARSNVTACTVKQSVSLDTSRYFIGNSGFKSEQIENGFRSITGTMTIEWLSAETMYNAYAADTTTSLQLTLTGAVAGTSGTNTYLLDIIIPNIKLDGESPKVSGPGIVTQSVSFTGLDDETTVPIQVIYQTEDSAF